VTSIYQRALGSEFERLHPEIQARFGFSSEDGYGSIGIGVMDEIWRARGFTRPFLAFGAWRNLMFSDTGRDVPFTIENWPYVDRYGRETVTFVRTFELPHGRRRFDATMIYSETRGRIVDYLGTHQHLAADVELSVDDDGGLRLRTGAQRFYERSLAFSFPMWLSGTGEVHEWYDEQAGRHRIEVVVTNRLVGPLFGYHGSFTAVQRPVPPEGVPPSVKPKREERRE
jgi:hypothetical protein